MSAGAPGGGARAAGGGAAATGLRLKAADAEDFGMLSACLQDALVPVGDMGFLQEEKRFVLVANRFRWENCGETAEMPLAALAPELDIALGPGCRAYERVLCGVTFEGVTRVRRRGIDQAQRGRILELLAIHPDVPAPGAATAGGAAAGGESGDAAGGAAVVLEFAGDAAIRLEGERIVCWLGDLGEPWPTQWRPRHPAGEGA